MQAEERAQLKSSFISLGIMGPSSGYGEGCSTGYLPQLSRKPGGILEGKNTKS